MCKMPCSWDSRRPAPQHSPMVKSNGCRLDHQLASAAVLFHRVVHAVFPGDFIKLPDGRVGDLDVGNALVYVSVLVLGLLSSVLAFLGVFLLIVGPRHDGVDRPGDRVPVKPLRSAAGGNLAAGKGAGFEICYSG